MDSKNERFSGCGNGRTGATRREFLRVAGTTALATGVGPLIAASEIQAPESLVKTLYNSFSETQRRVVTFDWNYRHPRWGLLRTRVANNWHITEPTLNSEFFDDDQREILRAIFEGIYNPDWVDRVDQQLQDDAGGYGNHQNIAVFGNPNDGAFELVMTGRHLTIRCDGNSTESVAFGGPIFYGHAAESFREKASHPGNVYWPQALQANRIFTMLDGAQRDLALQPRRPREKEVSFRGPHGHFDGLPLSELTNDQTKEVQKTLQLLIEPYRAADRNEALACLRQQGGLDACSLAFYQSGDIGGDGVWDNWRLEGPSFVWYFRGSPHVHVWVNVASDPEIALNAD